MRALIDGDVVRYEVGAKCEGEDGPLSFDHCEKQLNGLIDHIKLQTGATDVVIYLTGDTNFRNDIAVTKPYKGNRKSTKPFHWKNISAYLRNRYTTREREGFEADDLMAIDQWYALTEGRPNDTIICTRDKDLRMVPGWQFGWECGAQREYGPVLVEEKGTLVLDRDKKPAKLTGTGMAFFYSQLLTGDPVDNIPGVPRVGAVKAFEVLTEGEDDMYRAVEAVYREKGLTKQYMEEQIDLLWMVREVTILGDPVPWRPEGGIDLPDEAESESG